MRRLLVLLFLVAALLSACGDDGDKDNVASRSTTTEADDAAADEGAEDDEESDKDFSGKGSDDFCDKARDYEKKFEDIGRTGVDAKEEWEELEDAFDDIASSAPDEIEADVALIQKNFKEGKKLYEKYDYDFAKVPQEEAAAINTEGVEEANERVNSYMETVCKIDQDGDGDTDGATDGEDFEEEPPPAEDTTP